MDLLSAFPPLISACNQPSYTNYVGGFQGCLDYIFIQPESMQVWTLAVLTVQILLITLLVEFLFKQYFIHSEMKPLLPWPGLIDFLKTAVVRSNMPCRFFLKCL